jgi:hypothetical protein
VMASPLNNVFTCRNVHMCLQCAEYQARGGSNFPRQTRAFRTHKPTAEESLECVIRETPGIYVYIYIYIYIYKMYVYILGKY